MYKIVLKENYEKMSKTAAEFILRVIREKPEAVIVLATGHSPLLAYRCLVDRIREEKADLSEVTFVKLDEWVGLSAEDEATCECFLRREVIGPLGIREEKYLHFETDIEDPEAESERIDRLYRQLPPPELVILGIGKNGHLGLNEPGERLSCSAHSVTLSRKTKTHEMLTHAQQEVSCGITLGIGNLFAAKKVLLLADGEEKEEGLRSLLSDEVSTQQPVSLLKLHPDCTCLVNRESFPDWREY